MALIWPRAPYTTLGPLYGLGGIVRPLISSLISPLWPLIAPHDDKTTRRRQPYRGVDLRAQSEIEDQSQLQHNNYGGAAEGRPPILIIFLLSLALDFTLGSKI